MRVTSKSYLLLSKNVTFASIWMNTTGLGQNGEVFNFFNLKMGQVQVHSGLFGKFDRA